MQPKPITAQPDAKSIEFKVHVEYQSLPTYNQWLDLVFAKLVSTTPHSIFEITREITCLCFEVVFRCNWLQATTKAAVTTLRISRKLAGGTARGGEAAWTVRFRVAVIIGTKNECIFFGTNIIIHLLHAVIYQAGGGERHRVFFLV
jgi:hypothetical protein